MSTGVESWNTNLLDIGPMYPFAGTEVLWALIGIGSWILWHIIQGRIDSRVLREEDQAFSEKEHLEQAIQLSSAETLKEQAKSHAEEFKRG